MVKLTTDQNNSRLRPMRSASQPRDRQCDSGRDDIAGQHPVDAFLRRAEARLHVRQRDIGDGGIQHLDQHGQHHRDGGSHDTFGRRQRVGR